MKFLEDDKLAQLTADLTDAPLAGCQGGGHSGQYASATNVYDGTSRIINGRIEAYTMKRVSSDKKYAHALGEKYLQEMDQAEEEMERFHRSCLGLPAEEAGGGGGSGGGGSSSGSGRRLRAGSIDEWKRQKFGVAKQQSGGKAGKPDKEGVPPNSNKQKDDDEARERDSSASPKLTGKSGPGGSRAGRKPDKEAGGTNDDEAVGGGGAATASRGSRRRSKSVDLGGVAKATAAAAAAASSAARVTISTEPTEPASRRTKGGSSSGSGDGNGDSGGADPQQPLASIMKPRERGRYRSSSFDTSRGRTQGGGIGGDPALHSHGYFSNSSLGDFHEMGTRRLMTDLILTLNASFPDYDFGSVRPDHFVRLAGATAAVNRVNERLSEFAATLPATALHGGGRYGGVVDAYHRGYGYGPSSARDDGSVFLQKLWGAIDDVIVLNDCEVYSYVPPAGDNDDDPLGFLTETLAPGGGGGGVGPRGVAAATAATDGMATSAAVGSSSVLEAISDTAASSPSSTVAASRRQGAAAAVGASMPLWTFNYFFVNKSLKRIVLFACVQTMQNDAPLDMDEDMDDVDGADRIRSPSGMAALADADTTPSRYGYDDGEDDVDSPPTGIARGGGGGARRQLLGMSASGAGRVTDGGGVSGYYSMSSTDARTDEEYDEFDTGNLAEDVGRPATPGTPVSVQ